ncbi:aminotransferase class I/II-fold pyridoxal phosphate-dependent enzyme [Brevibacterium sp. 5221]|uniref:cysteine-S-conjugate beta-lyase n=1 Tax=Brevibacterium rongguiense TaxID=2695267 RepID=A0A6N9H8L9_9MICO|nr:aminotransferase class I/II-fold pyridoxal phosphate-dependent enzyme [Brevibacterium rongguiense]MYM20430.1 aminotransferase class I/II-fold pyridoxal phosphate-dependent enzyme [Brevibacterium rongguiense]
MTDRNAITRQQLEERASKKWSQFPGAIGAWIAEMDFPVAQPIRDSLVDFDARELYGYAPDAVKDDMRRATADFYARRYGWEFAPEYVDTASDVLSGMGAVLDLFSEPGSAVIVPTPNYMPFFTVPGLHGRRIIQVPMLHEAGQWSFDLEGIARAFDDGAGLLIMCNPHNPIGRVYTREELLAVSEVVERKGGRVFSDEIHAPLTYEGRRHVPYASVSPAAAAHTVTVTSASKSFNTPGLKCAQIIFSNDADLDVWKAKGHFIAEGASTPGILAAIAAYDRGGEWLADTIDYLQGNRDALADDLAELLPQVGYEKPEGTYVAWLDVRRLGIPGNPQRFFLDSARVATTDGELCGRAGDGHVRFNMALPRPILREAVESMAAAVDAL